MTGSTLRWWCPVVDKFDLDLVFALLGHNAADVAAHTLNVSKSPDLQRSPSIVQALDIALQDIFTLPFLLQEVVCDLGDLDEPANEHQ